MASARPPVTDNKLGQTSRTSAAGHPRNSATQSLSTWQYRVPKESPFAWFLAISLILFTSAVLLSVLIPRGDELPPMIEVDLGIEGVENEPPPLGDPDAGAGEQPPEPTPPEPEPEKPEMEQQPEPTPEPEPMPEEPLVQPPEPAPTFVVPEEPKAPEPPPAPKPVTKQVAKPKPAPTAVRPSVSGNGIPGANTGVRGSPTGQPGGKGGGRSDFLYVPRPKYDATARQRGYQGRGIFLITYQNGRVIGVSTHQSTGVPYLDALTMASLKSECRLKPGTSGSVRYPITWQLK